MLKIQKSSHSISPIRFVLHSTTNTSSNIANLPLHTIEPVSLYARSILQAILGGFWFGTAQKSTLGCGLEWIFGANRIIKVMLFGQSMDAESGGQGASFGGARTKEQVEGVLRKETAKKAGRRGRVQKLKAYRSF